MFNNLAEFVRRLFGGGHTLELVLAIVAVGVVAFVWRARYLRAKPGGAPYSGWKFSELRRGDPTLEPAASNGATPHYDEPEDEPPINPPLPELRVAPTFVADPEPVSAHVPEPEAVPVAALLAVHEASLNGTNGVAHELVHEVTHDYSNGHSNGTAHVSPNDGVPVDDTIVFPTGRGFGDFRMVELPPPRTPSFEPPETTAISTILAGGLDEIAGSGDQLADAVRERPIQYLIGALAAGFAAGIVVPALAGQNRIEKLLKRLVEGQEEIRRSRLP